MTKEQSWILTDLDAHTIDFENFKYDYTNFTMFRSVDYSRPFVKHSLHKYEKIIIFSALFLTFTKGLWRKSF